MKNIFNFRFLFILALVALFANLAVTYLVGTTAKLFVFVAAAVLLCVSIFVLSIKSNTISKLIFVSLIIVSAISLNMCIRSYKLNKNLALPNQNVIITGTISQPLEQNNNSISIFLENVSVCSADGSTKAEVDGTFVIYTIPENLDLRDFKLGRVISLKVNELNFYSLSDRENLSRSINYLSGGVVASGFSFYFTVNFSDEYKLSLKNRIKSFVADRLDALNMSQSKIGYAMLFGDRAYLDRSVSDYFSSTGTAHLLAVSGFHVSILILLLNFILRKLGLKDYIRVPVVVAFLGFYVYLCSFYVSIVRAAIMSVISLIISSRHSQHDQLSSLSFALTVILIFMPLSMYGISFVLSFTATFAIICLAPPLNRFFLKFLHRKFASFLSVTIAVQVGMAVTTIYYFHKLPLVSLLANLVIVPAMTFTYSLFVVFLLVYLILPFMSFLFYAYQFLMDIILSLLQLANNINVIVYIADMPLYVVVVSLLSVFLLSDFVMLKKREKIIDLALFICLIVAAMVVPTLLHA